MEAARRNLQRLEQEYEGKQETAQKVGHSWEEGHSDCAKNASGPGCPLAAKSLIANCGLLVRWFARQVWSGE